MVLAGHLPGFKKIRLYCRHFWCSHSNYICCFTCFPISFSIICTSFVSHSSISPPNSFVFGYCLADGGRTQSYRTFKQAMRDSPKDSSFGWWYTEITSPKSSLSRLSVHGERVIRANDKSLSPPQLCWKPFSHHWSSGTSFLWCHRDGDQVSCTFHLPDTSQTPVP